MDGHLHRVPLPLAQYSLRHRPCIRRRHGVRTYCYLFTWESPAFGGVLGSCHALEIPFVFGTVHLQGVQMFSGGGDEAFALSAAMRRAWVRLCPVGLAGPSGVGWSGWAGRLRSRLVAGRAGDWSIWDPARRPTMVLGPWPGSQGMQRLVDAPRDEELETVAAACDPDLVSGPAGAHRLT